MERESRKFLYYHILGWSFYFLTKVTDVILVTPIVWVRVYWSFTYLLTVMVTFYYFYHVVGSKDFNIKKIPAILFGFILFIGTRAFLEEWLTESLFGFSNYYDHLSWLYYIRDNIARVLLPLMAGVLAHSLVHRNRVESENRLLQTAKYEAELSMLRSQLNPHFLFNTMSFLYAESSKYNESLADDILSLSEVLRYSLRNSLTDQATLMEEVDVIRHYISIFKGRYKDSFHVNFSHTIDDPDVLIEPFLLLPFVENAIKHGNFRDDKNPIRININHQNGVMEFYCSNKIKEKEKDNQGGIGIENMKKRLLFLYPKKHDLRLLKEGENYIVKLKVKL